LLALVLFLSFLVLIFLGFPIAFSLGISSMIYLLLADIPLNIIPQKMFAGLNSFVLLSIPGFILAGHLMNYGGITDRIIRFTNSIFGRITGGLAHVNIGASMLFSGISGTALAEAASIGSVLIPAMKKAGYGAAFSAAVTSSASTTGPIIPPSVPFIIVGTLAGISIGDLHLAGTIPGILIGAALMLVAYIISKKRNYPKGEPTSLKEIAKTFVSAFWALMMPFVIMYGILGGFFTPTEAAIVSVIYGLIVGMLIYKELRPQDLPGALLDTMIGTASVMILVGFANLFGWILVSEQIPQMVADFILSISNNKVVVILMINLFLLFVGMFMETIAALVILFPVLLPVATAVDMEPIQFAMMMVLNLTIGLLTPPVGVCLFVGASIAKVSMGEAVRALVPFLIALLIVLLLVSFIPELSLFLPDLYHQLKGS